MQRRGRPHVLEVDGIEGESKDAAHKGEMKLLQGKSCFHVRKLDDELLHQIEEAVQAGLDLYRERGWA